MMIMMTMRRRWWCYGRLTLMWYFFPFLCSCDDDNTSVYNPEHVSLKKMERRLRLPCVQKPCLYTRHTHTLAILLPFPLNKYDVMHDCWEWWSPSTSWFEHGKVASGQITNITSKRGSSISPIELRQKEYWNEEKMRLKEKKTNILFHVAVLFASILFSMVHQRSTGW